MSVSSLTHVRQPSSSGTTVAGERAGAMISAAGAVPAAGVTNVPSPKAEGGIPPHANIVHGYDVEALVDAAMGIRPMPTAPVYLDGFGMPLTRLAPAGMIPAPATPAQSSAPGPSPLDIANAALAAAAGHVGGVGGGATRVLVLSNMVVPEDLATDEDYAGLKEEVQEECAKFGKLLGMQIPRKPGGNIQPSAIQKIFLEYATIEDAQAADGELKGRKFGDNVVKVSFRLSDYGFVASLLLTGYSTQMFGRQASFRKRITLLEDSTRVLLIRVSSSFISVWRQC